MKKINRMILCFYTFCLLASCGGSDADPDKGGRISIAAMNGPTMMGLGRLYAEANGGPDSKYTITKEAVPDAIIAGLANGTFDAACLPANNAAIIFNTGSIGIKVAAINTLNVLYLMQKAGTPPLASLGDLAGKTVYLPGQGSTPEFAFRYLLAKNNIANVTLEFETEGSTIAAGIKSTGSKYDYAVLPQPAATSAASGGGAAVELFNLTGEWKKHNPDSDIVTGVLVVRSAFLKNNKAAFDNFLAAYRQSVEFMTDPQNAETAAAYIVDMGIIPAPPVTKAALPKCGITFIDKAAMKSTLADFYGVLFGQNVNSVGGKLPADDFYYE